jgi:hypothetical protein
MPSWRAPGAYAVSAYANVTSRDSSAPLAGAAPRVTAVIHVEAGVPEIINTPPVTIGQGTFLKMVSVGWTSGQVPTAP